MIQINGQDGGGQVLRSALSLSMVTGEPFRMVNIRGKRPKPGLKRQHLTCVQAAAAICDAEVGGVEMNSTSITFTPGAVKHGEYAFAIGSAGSTTLVFQTLLPALMLADGESVVKVEGGTHNPMAPSADFISKVFLPAAAKWGVNAEMTCERVGFAPAGGGRVVSKIRPSILTPHDLTDRGEIQRKEITSMVVGISGEIMKREVKAAQKKLVWEDAEIVLEQVNDADGTGNCFAVHVDFANLSDRFTEYGSYGVSSERVAGNAAKNVKRHLSSEAAVSEHLADQLILPMALAGAGSFTVRRLTNHLRTNIAVVHKFLDVRFEVEELEGVIRVGVA
ncbi:RNA 3'-terminal phosphate cyclase [Rubritalea halochordaticola]|uniref:RNA 3'-terminal phosphate cyclase n=1 Tax=Rubritalea halochordaticola TaxID=714537 RepID=A0ABP9UZB3_9BACT